MSNGPSTVDTHTRAGLPGPDPELAARVAALARADWRAVAEIYRAGQSSGHQQAQDEAARWWARVSRWIKATANTPSFPELQHRRGLAFDYDTGRWRPIEHLYPHRATTPEGAA